MAVVSIEMDLRIATKTLERQVKAVLDSNLSPSDKAGVHNLLSDILDATVIKRKYNCSIKGVGLNNV